MKIKKALLLLVALPQILIAQTDFLSEEIRPLVNFVEQCNTSPVDYIMGLFDKYDVVVLGERDHRDMTQYDLIQQIISDPRFIEKVGHIFTEVGGYNWNDELNAVLKGTYPDDAVFDKKLAQIIFDIDNFWEKTNYTKLMKDVYLVNKNLPSEKKISITPTEFSFSWRQVGKMTEQEREKLMTSVRNEIWKKHKDMIMGNNAITEIYKIFNGNNSRKKVLVIYNTPHSCRYFENQDNRYPYFAYQIIADRFPGRVANVMVNWAVMSNDSGYSSLSNNGKLDAAFAACGYKSIGFDLEKSPLGELVFDIEKSLLVSEIKMKDVYHGFIFYKPVHEWVIGIGIPNLEKKVYRDEFLRRTQIYGNIKGIKKIIFRTVLRNEEFKYYTTVRTLPMNVEFSDAQYNEQIRRYQSHD